MTKIFQTIIDKDHGNCMQAVVASLFDLKLDEVPNFIELGKKWHKTFDDFIKSNGYEFSYINRSSNSATELLKKIAVFDGGVDGYFFGVVNSQTYENVTHAVVVDSDLNIVHDPNPNQKAMLLTPDDIVGFYVTKDIVICDNEIMLYSDYINKDVV